MLHSRIFWTATAAAMIAAHPNASPGLAQTAVFATTAADAAGPTVCERFADRVDQFAARHSTDTDGFLAALRSEFVAGAADPIGLRDALEAGRWNQAFFYAGHGGFAEPLDDNRAKYARGGNHQPGHFVAMLSITRQYGPQVAQYASQAAGDNTPGQQDDLRLSHAAIALGTGLASATLRPADIAHETRQFCRANTNMPARQASR